MKCPICEKENTLSLVELTQNTRTWKIKKDGSKSKKCCNVEKDLYIDDGCILTCSNGCEVNDFAWEIIENKLVIYTETKYKTKNFNIGEKYGKFRNSKQRT